MAKNHMTYTAFLLYVAPLIQTTWSAYLPEGEYRRLNQLDTIEQQRQHAQHNINENALWYDESKDEKEEKQQPQHHKSYDKNDDVVYELTYDDDDVSVDVQLKKSEEHSEEQSYSNEEDAYSDISSSEPSSRVLIRKRRQLSDWLIAPNTHWCGRGNTANGTYNHLGGASAADKCCRKHDHCSLYIPAMSNRYELFNYRPYTLSHCQCDRRFRTCLKMANDDDAKTIGKLFFNMVQTQCFILRAEKMCQERNAEDGSCESKIVKHKGFLKNNKRF